MNFGNLKMDDLVQTHMGETARVISPPSVSETRGKLRVELLLITGPRTGKGTWAEKCPDAEVTLVS
jgi:hypothetical protein